MVINNLNNLLLSLVCILVVIERYFYDCGKMSPYV